MLCSNPFLRPGFPVRCGQCAPCRVYFRRLWTGRLLLEWCLHEGSSFVTLTYDELQVPRGGNLEPHDVRLWLKAMRRAFGPFRYFVVGEYGDRTLRPHYHAILFGLTLSSDQVAAVWKKGICTSDEFNKARAGYVCGYVLKKMTKKDDPRLQGRHPEFSRMSLKPGLGYGSLSAIVRMGVGSEAARNRLAYYADHGYFRFLGQKFPLGRYLTGKLRDQVTGGLSKEDRLAKAQLEYRILSLDRAWRLSQVRKRKQHEQVARAQFRKKHNV